MREIAMIFICIAGVLVTGFWVLVIIFTIRSGRGINSLFARRPKHQWLSIPDTIDQYGDDPLFWLAESDRVSTSRNG
jgi:hypothetical protein